jgi:hypothetical protein
VKRLAVALWPQIENNFNLRTGKQKAALWLGGSRVLRVGVFYFTLTFAIQPQIGP